MYALTKVWHPSYFQDGRTGLGYFEGWYFKVVDPTRTRALAVIPGVSIERTGSRHAFVQVILGDGRAHWFDFPWESFAYARDRFDITVGRCRFTDREIVMDLDDGTFSVRGTLALGEPAPWPVRALSPGVMGPFRFVPFMECYHGVLSLDHTVDGDLMVDGEGIVFDGGRGYSEKDWGRSFPSAWVWVQSNDFGRTGVSLTASIARIPWLGSSFVGSIVGLLVDGRLHRFATYTGAKLISLSHAPGGVEFVLQDRRHRIEVGASGAVPGVLRSPVLGQMVGQVEESLRGTVRVRLTERATGREVFAGEGRSSGIELMDPAGDLAT
jgi:tocopherol cyclase